MGKETDSLLGKHGESEKERRARYINMLLVTIGGSLIAIVSGTTNAFGFLQFSIQTDLGLSKETAATLSGVGLLGVYFTLPAGLMMERIGSAKACFVGIIFNIAGYTGMSFVKADQPALLIICFMLVGFGSGCTFLCVLNLAISVSPSGGGITMAVVSAAMSLSVAATIGMVMTYANDSGCESPPLWDCWRPYLRLLAIAIAILQFPGDAFLCFFNRKYYPHLREKDALAADQSSLQADIQTTKSNASSVASLAPLTIVVKDASQVPITLKESMLILKNAFFWMMFAGYFAGISSSVFILATASSIWDEYTGGMHANNPHYAWGKQILNVFSYSNAFSNVLVGMFVDWLVRTNRMTHRRFIGLVQLVFAVVFLGQGIMLATPHTSPVVFFFLVSLTGLGFGVYLVLFPTIMGVEFGFSNFGKFFSYLSIASSVASLATPVIAAAIEQGTGSYRTMCWILTGLLVVSGVGMLLIRKQPLLVKSIAQPSSTLRSVVSSGT